MCVTLRKQAKIATLLDQQEDLPNETVGQPPYLISICPAEKRAATSLPPLATFISNHEQALVFVDWWDEG